MNNNINIDAFVNLFTKYLDRVEAKGLVEIQEMGEIVAFVNGVKNREIVISFMSNQAPEGVGVVPGLGPNAVPPAIGEEND